jgi:hypothetical protein
MWNIADLKIKAPGSKAGSDELQLTKQVASEGRKITVAQTTPCLGRTATTKY